MLGVYVHDDGYVLGLQSNPKHYVDMPPPDMLADFQKQGTLPDPLPTYHLGVGDYLAGYSLWIVVVPLVGWLSLLLFRPGPWPTAAPPDAALGCRRRGDDDCRVSASSLPRAALSRFPPPCGNLHRRPWQSLPTIPNRTASPAASRAMRG